MTHDTFIALGGTALQMVIIYYWRKLRRKIKEEGTSK